MRQRQGKRSERREKKKEIEAERAKPYTPTGAIGALIGKEEQNKNRKKKSKRERAPYPAILDHSVESYDPQGSYSASYI